jgi:hypothetical protein
LSSQLPREFVCVIVLEAGVKSRRMETVTSSFPLP